MTEEKKPRLLITGASGLLGWHLSAAAKQSHEVNGIYHSHATSMDGVQMIECDLTDEKAISELVNANLPDVIIHCAAFSDPNSCQKEPELSRKINIDSSIQLAELAQSKNIPMCFISTDLVFDGKQGNYNESSPLNPISLYGEQKVETENHVLGISDRHLVCRAPLMYGPPSPHSHSFLKFMLDKIENKEDLTLFEDEYRTPADARCVALGILQLLKVEANGIIHLGGRERLSRFEFGQILTDALGHGHEFIKAILQKELKMSAPRPADVSLNSEKAYALGYSPKLVKERLDFLNQ